MYVNLKVWEMSIDDYKKEMMHNQSFQFHALQLIHIEGKYKLI